jgi:hypothetical protein
MGLRGGSRCRNLSSVYYVPKASSRTALSADVRWRSLGLVGDSGGAPFVDTDPIRLNPFIQDNFVGRINYGDHAYKTYGVFSASIHRLFPVAVDTRLELVAGASLHGPGILKTTDVARVMDGGGHLGIAVHQTVSRFLAIRLDVLAS